MTDTLYVAGFGETTGLLPNSIMRVEDTLLRMKRQKCWRMICVGCLEKVEVPTVLSQGKTDMPEHLYNEKAAELVAFCINIMHDVVTSFECSSCCTRLHCQSHAGRGSVSLRHRLAVRHRPSKPLRCSSSFSLFLPHFLVLSVVHEYKLITGVPKFPVLVQWTNLYLPTSPPRSPF